MSWFKRNKKDENDASSKKKNGYSIREIFDGNILVRDFLQKHFILILVITGFLILSISNRYSMNKKLVTIEELKKNLKDVKYDAQIIDMELISNSRPAQIERKLKERNIELSDPVEPAYEIHK